MAMSIERVSSGIPGFDEMTEGGFVRGHTVLLCGSYGAGKTTFCMQFLVHGARNNEPGLYITFEEDPEQLIEEAEAFGWEVKKLIAENRLKILTISPRDLLNLVEAGFGQVSGIMKNMNVKRIAVDSIVAFNMLGREDYERRGYALEFVKWLKKHACTAIMTTDCIPGMTEGRCTGIAESAADAIIALYHPQERGKRTRAIEILKMRETSHSNNLVEFEITKNGMVVHSAKVSSRGQRETD
jgi:KaiC/GvpD/RAD55 family RecA-like ATPase